MYEIQFLLKNGYNSIAIAKEISKDKSVVSREIKCDNNPKGIYKTK